MTASYLNLNPQTLSASPLRKPPPSSHQCTWNGLSTQDPQRESGQRLESRQSDQGARLSRAARGKTWLLHWQRPCPGPPTGLAGETVAESSLGPGWPPTMFADFSICIQPLRQLGPTRQTTQQSSLFYTPSL